MIDISDKHDIIKNAYISYGFPGESRLYTLLSKDHKDITKDELEAEEFNIMQTFNPDILLNENTVYKKRSAAHVKKIADGNTGEKSVCFKFGSVFKRSGTCSEGYPITAWCFSYLVHDPKKRTIRFQFSIKKYGDEGAKQLAEDKQKEIYPTMEE